MATGAFPGDDARGAEGNRPMIKRLTCCALATGALVVSMSGAAAAAPSAASHGVGNGAVGCTLANGVDYANPAAMLKYLTSRDGSFQTTVSKYNFGTVANLIDKKCGA